jgi:hypothetical protein
MGKSPKYETKGGEPMKGMGYAGKIQNSGVQEVKAPNQSKGKQPSGKVTKGSDLRTGKGGK